jgi:siroheme synthase (precorrin-2 oxidase/ferrochelatase)
VNTSVVEAAISRGILVCDASNADRSRVAFGASLHVDGMTIAVFSGGRDPARARDVRNRIGELLNGVDEEEVER